MIRLSAPSVGAAEAEAVLRVLRSGHLVTGPEVSAFEREFASACHSEHAVAVSSGTHALWLALLAAGIGPGDEVVTTPMSFFATAEAIVLCGATPVFADIEPHTFNLDVERARAAITPRTKAIVLVHLFGCPCDLDAFGALARQHSLTLLEDAAQAIGASWGGRKVGSQNLAAFSLYATKNVTSVEGGMITTQDPALAARLQRLRHHGTSAPGVHDEVGVNARMSDVHAAIGRVQLSRLDDWTRARQACARAFDAALAGVVEIPRVPALAEHVYHHYTVRLSGAVAAERDRALAHLQELGVQAGVFYRRPLHLQPALQRFTRDVRLPVAERASEEVLSLPVHPGVGPEEREQIIAAVRSL